MRNNQLSSLPNSIGNLKLKSLRLPENRFKEIPYSLGLIDTLETIDLEKNEFSGIEAKYVKKLSGPLEYVESKGYVNKGLEAIQDYLKQRSSMAIFVSHAVIDYEPYRLAELGEYLEKKPEVYDVLLCEQDLSGNIDQFMDQNVPISDVVFFLGTNKSVFNSPDCAHELELSEKYSVPVYPMKGTDVIWEDMNTIGLKKDPGTDYTPETFEDVCEQLYAYVKQFHAAHQGPYKIKQTIFEDDVPAAEGIEVGITKEEDELVKLSSTEFSLESFKAVLDYFLESSMLKNFYSAQEASVDVLMKQLRSGEIDDRSFIMTITQLMGYFNF